MHFLRQQNGMFLTEDSPRDSEVVLIVYKVNGLPVKALFLLVHISLYYGTKCLSKAYLDYSVFWLG